MTITLKPELEAFAEQQARDQGLADASTYVNKLVEEQRSREVPEEETT